MRWQRSSQMELQNWISIIYLFFSISIDVNECFDLIHDTKCNVLLQKYDYSSQSNNGFFI